ncbi:DUF523 domain-containing protein [Rhodobacter sp. NTK016B]|uniref:DUF523 domain-containing protein n=1 Tax=Rhodobacter sp. NTK016B TaxID=2759676 RepID=UPI001A8E93E9|nr:DUF523 domain-containing protein [Rhodobacter sp. NTK016B]MBN8293024.1 DUF523 domain-containing protein [Rhodobacter sp. NTK016B]
MSRILVSACLLGAPVRYDGRAKTLSGSLIENWRATDRLVSLCPEVSAGLATPRRPAEIEPGASAAEVLDGTARVLTDTGEDVTAYFVRGAQIALDTAKARDCHVALLTDASPSCGSRWVYSGHHDGSRQTGRGVVSELLERNGIRVFSPRDIAALASALA